MSIYTCDVKEPNRIDIIYQLISYNYWYIIRHSITYEGGSLQLYAKERILLSLSYLFTF